MPAIQTVDWNSTWIYSNCRFVSGVHEADNRGRKEEEQQQRSRSQERRDPTSEEHAHRQQRDQCLQEYCLSFHDFSNPLFRSFGVVIGIHASYLHRAQQKDSVLRRNSSRRVPIAPADIWLSAAVSHLQFGPTDPFNDVGIRPPTRRFEFPSYTNVKTENEQ